MAAPYEILATPFEAFLAPAGTAKPDIASAPTGQGYTRLGIRGADEYDADAGVSISHDQTINEYRGLRGTGPIKAFRTSESLKIAFTLNDMSLEQYGKVLNDATVEDVGSRALTIHQGAQVATFALVLKSDDGPYGDGDPIQYWVPVVYQSGSPTVVHKKGEPAGLALEFTALEWLDSPSEALRFGIVEAQDSTGS